MKRRAAFCASREDSGGGRAGIVPQGIADRFFLKQVIRTRESRHQKTDGLEGHYHDQVNVVRGARFPLHAGSDRSRNHIIDPQRFQDRDDLF
jgi:hypothetical protein